MNMDIMLMAMFVVIIVAGLVLMAMISGFGKRRSGLDNKLYAERWQRIESLQQTGDAGWQVAIIEADKLVDMALKARGYSGETMGERLKSARTAFRNNDHTWQAHKLRNRIAHEHDVRLNSLMVSQALRSFKAALKDLGAL
jgi:transposase